jgi:NAD(P)-dependent dehydrogenase (short-subunit alcohol dehydrogenase family)
VIKVNHVGFIRTKILKISILNDVDPWSVYKKLKAKIRFHLYLEYIYGSKKYLLKKGKVLITGGTSGLGYDLVKHFLTEGYEVFTTGRDHSRLSKSGGELQFLKTDFSDLDDVKSVIQKILNNGTRFDIVINNAGVLSPPEYSPTVNGFEYSFQVNFLSHLLINDLILRAKSKADALTIASVTSPVYKYVKPDFKLPERPGYKAFKTYSESKLYLLFIGEYLLKRHPGNDFNYICFNPGIFSSGIYRMQKSWFHRMYRIGAPFMRSPSHVAHLFAEILNEEALISGSVYRSKNRFRKPDNIGKEEIEIFMAKCYGKIERFTI